MNDRPPSPTPEPVLDNRPVIDGKLFNDWIGLPNDDLTNRLRDALTFLTNAPRSNMKVPQDHKDTLYYIAKVRGQCDLTKDFLDKGANENATHNGLTADEYLALPLEARRATATISSREISAVFVAVAGTAAVLFTAFHMDPQRSDNALLSAMFNAALGGNGTGIGRG